MTIEDERIGRNELCSCGSGKKFKRCCGSVDVAKEDVVSRFFGIASVLAVLMLVAAVVVGARIMFFDDAPKKVWSSEHGHYHTVGGSAQASDAGPGKVWNEAHGHYHDVAGGAPPLEASTPVAGALEGLRAAELDAARRKVAGSDDQ